MPWHIDCPFKDKSLSDKSKSTLQGSFVAHMADAHKTPEPQAIHYFTSNCHQ